MAITTFITEYTGSVPNRQGDTPLAFAQNVYDYQVWIDAHLAQDSSEMATQMNTTSNEVESNRAEVAQNRNDTLNFKSESVSAKDRAENAANRAEAVVIPTEATYNIEALETSLNGLLTNSVAQTAQISILTQGL